MSIRSEPLPAASVKPSKPSGTLRDLCVLGSIYTAQFMPGSFFGIALVAILREQGVPLERLALLYVFGILMMLGIVWSPFVDRLRFGSLGHYRGWLILTQSVTVLSLVVIAQFDIEDDYMPTIWVGMVLAFVGAFGALATDALACRLLPPERRGLGNGIQVAGGFLGHLLGGGFLLALYPLVGWSLSITVLIVAAAIPLGLLVALQRPDVSEDEGSPAPIGAHYRRFLRLWQAPGGWRWLVLILCYPVGVAVSQSVFKPMLVDAKWSLAAIGLIANVLGAVAAMVGAMSGGWLVRHLGRRRLLRVIPLVQAASIAPLLAVAAGYTGQTMVAVTSIVTMLAFSPGTAIVMTVAMDRVSAEHTGTDYALQSTAYFLSLLVAGMLGLQIAAAFGYSATIAVGAASCIVCAVVAFRQTAGESSLKLLD